MTIYPPELLSSIYELGRMYFEMGYFAPAEKIFQGLVAVDKGSTPSRVGLGLVKIERGRYQEATMNFRSSIQSGYYELQAKMGMVFSFIAQGELSRAMSMLTQIDGEHREEIMRDEGVRTLFEAAYIRCKNSA